MSTLPPPNVEECLAAAAFQILTDNRFHSSDAKTWAQQFIQEAARGSLTEFQRVLGMREVHA